MDRTLFQLKGVRPLMILLGLFSLGQGLAVIGQAFRVSPSGDDTLSGEADCRCVSTVASVQLRLDHSTDVRLATTRRRWTLCRSVE